MKLFSVLAGLLVVLPVFSQTDSDIIADLPPDRMWLPRDSEYLRPYLNAAVLRALANDDCKQMLYARVNEFRSQDSDPVFTILCLKDRRTTFNLVFPIAELDPSYLAPSRTEMEAAGQNEDAAEPLSPMLQELRELLLLDPGQVISAPVPVPPASSSEPARPSRDPQSLDLDLEEMLQASPPRPAVTPAEIF
ncbi:MAG: hypothetical protein RQ757_00230 [Pseudomonadales bacterium]|nr:hypothetical protein [Pseudomonadales bacterium]